MCVHISIHTPICVCIYTQIYQKFYFNLLAKNRFRVYHGIFVSKFKTFACLYFRWLELRVSKSSGWLGVLTCSVSSLALVGLLRGRVCQSHFQPHTIHNLAMQCSYGLAGTCSVCKFCIAHIFSSHKINTYQLSKTTGRGGKKRKGNSQIFLQHLQSEAHMIFVNCKNSIFISMLPICIFPSLELWVEVQMNTRSSQMFSMKYYNRTTNISDFSLI